MSAGLYPALDHFVGRRKELGFLENQWKSNQSVFLPIYGRRRVGKSELILKFMADKPGLYMAGKQAPAALQIKEFLAQAARVFDEPLLAQALVKTWKEALSLVTDRWKGPGKFLLVLDEFQWMAESSEDLPSTIQEIWDQNWSRRNDLFLVLCGSYMGFMEREVLGKKSPLYGRRTGQILLRPFDYLEAGEFHPNYSVTDKARAYFLCGGVPLYHKLFSDRQSIDANIRGNLLSEFAPLFREAEFLLREELQDPEKYYAVLQAIATGRTTNKEIAQESGVPQNSLNWYLTQLMELQYITKRHPLSAEASRGRSVRYAIEDSLLRFWFHFVFPNQSFIARQGPEKAFSEIVAPGLDSYFGHCFERLCRSALPMLYGKEGVTASHEVGEFWAKDVQIDVVGVREDNWTDLGECKWRHPQPAPGTIARELEEKVRAFPNSRNATIQQHAFTRTPAGKSAGKYPRVRWHSLDDLYTLPLPS